MVASRTLRCCAIAVASLVIGVSEIMMVGSESDPSANTSSTFVIEYSFRLSPGGRFAPRELYEDVLAESAFRTPDAAPLAPDRIPDVAAWEHARRGFAMDGSIAYAFLILCSVTPWDVAIAVCIPSAVRIS
ncbi:hypothetical protein D3C77_328410 [compost metagenome]